MGDPFEPKHRERTPAGVTETSRWSTCLALLLGVYAGIFLLTLAASALVGGPSESGVLRIDPTRIDRHVGLSLEEVGAQPWRLVTFLLFHSPVDPFHFCIVLLSLVVVLPGLEGRFGRRTVLILFVACGMGAGLCHLAASALFPGLFDPGARTLGAAGAVYGLIAVYFWLFREEEYFGLLRGKILAPCLVAALFVSGIPSREDAVEYRPQAAGLLLGAAFLIAAPRVRLLRDRRKGAHRVQEIVRDAETHVRVDRLLHKISREGLDALTRSERRYLRKASRRYRRPPPAGGPPR